MTMTGVDGRDLQEFGKLVKQLRERVGATQKELARRTGGIVTAVHIGRIESPNDEIGVRREKVDALAEALDASDDERQMLLGLAGHGKSWTGPTNARRLADLESRVGEIADSVTKIDEVVKAVNDVVDRLSQLEERVARLHRASLSERQV